MAVRMPNWRMGIHWFPLVLPSVVAPQQAISALSVAAPSRPYPCRMEGDEAARVQHQVVIVVRADVGAVPVPAAVLGVDPFAEDLHRRAVREAIEAMQREARAPLDEWEAKE